MDKAKLIVLGIISVIVVLGVMQIIKLNKKQKELEAKLTINEPNKV